MERFEIEKMWSERFFQINNRKPTRLEKISWRVGFDCGFEYADEKTE